MFRSLWTMQAVEKANMPMRAKRTFCFRSSSTNGDINAIARSRPRATPMGPRWRPPSRLLSSSSSSPVANTSRSQGFAYGLLASVAIFSGILGYSMSDWRSRPSSNSSLSATERGKWSSGDFKYATSTELEAAIAELRQAFPDPNGILTDASQIKSFGYSENSYHESSPHQAVVKVNSTEDVAKVVKVANKYRIPVTAYGGGTSLEGHFSGYQSGSICIDLEQMDNILNINVEDADLTCQAGTRWEDINQILEQKGIPLFFPLDPGPGATIGGMIGTGCSGTNAVRYGTAKGEWFLNVTVVLPDGEIIKTRRRARKSSAGFDATKLFIGAEGTLGIVTEATLRLAPLLPTKVAFAQFTNVQHAVDAVQEVLTSAFGTHIQCVELVDDYTMSAINQAGLVDKPYPVKDSLFFKVQGTDDTIKQASKVIQKIVEKHGSSNFKFASTNQEADELWESRKFALTSTIASEPEAHAWTTDVCVPVSKLPQLVQETKEDLKASNLKAGIVGHVGDGNFHAFILFHDKGQLETVSQCVHRLVERAISLDGTCTGEHGVGVGKKEYLVPELGNGTVNLMKAVKDVIDPNHILNPGKLYPDCAGPQNKGR